MTVTEATASLEQRGEILARAVNLYVSKGWRVVSQTQTSAQLVKGHRTNHLLHLILTLITLGVWAIVWLLVAAFGGEQQQFISVNEQGAVTVH